MKTLGFYKNQIIVDQDAGRSDVPLCLISCNTCHLKYLVSNTRNALKCLACGTQGKVGGNDGNFERCLFTSELAYRKVPETNER